MIRDEDEVCTKPHLFLEQTRIKPSAVEVSPMQQERRAHRLGEASVRRSVYMVDSLSAWQLTLFRFSR